jgi:hypothetical protein
MLWDCNETQAHDGRSTMFNPTFIFAYEISLHEFKTRKNISPDRKYSILIYVLSFDLLKKLNNYHIFYYSLIYH